MCLLSLIKLVLSMIFDKSRHFVSTNTVSLIQVILSHNNLKVEYGLH